ncbi:MAG: hypothetical protein OHK0046_51580 [Anaerolineae bacterium]
MKVLLLDDDPKFRTLVIDILMAVAGTNYDVTPFADYDHALQESTTQLYDIFLVDYRLGEERTGLDFIHDLRKRRLSAPAILLTSQGNRSLDLTAMQIGFMDYLDKSSLTPELLERSVRYTIEHARALNDLRRLYEQVSELEQLKTDMIRLASHDFGNRVTNLMMTAGLLTKSLEGRASESEQKQLARMDKTLHEMRQLTTDILSLERIETTIHESHMDVIDLRELVVGICQDAQNHAPQMVQVMVEDAPTIVHGSATQLHEAVLNLVENAIKYTPPTGQIIIRLFHKAAYAMFEVEDTGYGIPEAQQRRLFQPFFRVATRETAGIGGTGLGLYIVKSIINRHNGDIWVKSVYQQGSVFGFRLPIKAE